ncbi:MAG TPA: AAA family ATPase [Ktedonobacterales bacterium]|nr:AAA family ATPase [Ktedonobacterales bacterium]
MEDGRQPLELAPAALRRQTDPAGLGFATTTELPAPTGMVGQERAQESIDFALEMNDSRYNLFVNGDPGTGRRIAVATAVEAIAKSRPAAKDWCYVYRFDQPEEPHAVALPPGMGRPFAHDVATFVQTARRELRQAFSSDAYATQRKELLSDIEPDHTALWSALREQIRALGFLVRATELGIAILPLRSSIGPQNVAPSGVGGNDESELDDEPLILSREEIDALPTAERNQLRARHEQAETLLKRNLPEITALEDEMAARIRVLNTATAEEALTQGIEPLVEQYAISADAVDFLRQLAGDMVAHADVLRGDVDDAGSASDAEGDEEDQGMDGSEGRVSLPALLRRYRVNVLVSHKPEDDAPIVIEMNPTRTNLLGRIESGTKRGLPFTDHMMIRAGALHRANGGFLIVQAHDLITTPHAWDTLKRVLRFGMIGMDSGGEPQGNPPGATLRPEPIPANVKAILIGDLSTYRPLMEQDPEFRLLFKVRADFADEMQRTPDAEQAYARFSANVARTSGGPPLAADAVATLIEEGSRWAEDQERLSTEFGSLRDLTLEACYWAKKEKAETTSAAHVSRAIAARERRTSLSEDKYNELIDEGQLVIETSGEVIGQVNGLSVRISTDHFYGVPMRITARTSPGVAGVTDIERETAMSGPSHSKGVLILSGFLAGRFAQDFPLSLSASICFEQNYEPIDGDSASSAELYTLLSSLSGVPIRQSLAVTGSVNQRGEIQAVGAVTAKVESFYRLCEIRGLDGHQGVLIPRANIRNLMLREEIVAAVKAGRFHIYAIGSVDEGIELLTGIPAGRPDRDNRYLEGTINARVSQMLRLYSDRVRAYIAGQNVGLARP